jgi:hypothetical protein
MSSPYNHTASHDHLPKYAVGAVYYFASHTSPISCDTDLTKWINYLRNAGGMERLKPKISRLGK